MERRGRRSDVSTESLQITLAKAETELLDLVVRTSKFGRNRNDVAARVIRDWIHDKLPAELEAYLKLKNIAGGFAEKVPPETAEEAT
jgi:hypothetical protein